MNRPELRIGDLERDAALTALGEHYAAGRLTKEEYDARADVAWQARTRGDLAPLFADLPALERPHHATRKGRPSRDRGRRPSLPVIPLILLVIVVAAVTNLEVWPFVLLVVAYLWLRAWIGVARTWRWVQVRARGPWGGVGCEPWRRPPPHR